MKLYSKEDLKHSIIFFNKKPPIFITIFVIFSIIIIISLFIFSLYFTKSYIIKANGEIITEDAAYLMSYASGQVYDIQKQDGDLIKNGDKIFHINNGLSNSDLEGLYVKKENIEAEIEIIDLFEKSMDEKINYIPKDTLHKSYYQKVEYYLSVLNNEKENISIQNNMLINRKEKLIQLNEEIKKLKENQDDNNSQELESKENEANSLEEEITSIENNINLISSQSSQIYYQMMIDSSTRKNELLLQDEDTKLSITEKEKNLESLIVSSQNEGVLHYLTEIKEGIAVSQGQIIGVILPTESKLKAEVFLESTDISKLSENNECRIEVLGTNTQKYGTLTGSIIKIDSGTINKEENGIIKSYYRAEIEFDNSFLTDNKGQKIFIKNSMPVQVRIIYDKETYFEWFLDLLNFDK